VKLFIIFYLILLVMNINSISINEFDLRDLVMQYEKKGNFDAVNPNLNYFAKINKRKVNIHDLESGELLFTLDHKDFVTCVAFSYNNKFIAVGGIYDVSLFVVDYSAKTCVRRIKIKEFDKINAVAFNPIENIFVYNARDQLYFCSFTEYQTSLINNFNHRIVENLCYSKNGEFIASSYKSTISVSNSVYGLKVFSSELDEEIISISPNQYENSFLYNSEKLTYKMDLETFQLKPLTSTYSYKKSR